MQGDQSKSCGDGSGDLQLMHGIMRQQGSKHKAGMVPEWRLRPVLTGAKPFGNPPSPLELSRGNGTGG